MLWNVQWAFDRFFRLTDCAGTVRELPYNMVIQTIPG